MTHREFLPPVFTGYKDTVKQVSATKPFPSSSLTYFLPRLFTVPTNSTAFTINGINQTGIQLPYFGCSDTGWCIDQFVDGCLDGSQTFFLSAIL
jgi:hypothetical protein